MACAGLVLGPGQLRCLGCPRLCVTALAQRARLSRVTAGPPPPGRAVASCPGRPGRAGERGGLLLSPDLSLPSPAR